MTYDTLKQEMGRELFAMVTLRCDRCVHVFGDGLPPTSKAGGCTASIEVLLAFADGDTAEFSDGDSWQLRDGEGAAQKCKNTYATCLDIPNYDAVGGTTRADNSKLYRFATKRVENAADHLATPGPAL